MESYAVCPQRYAYRHILGIDCGSKMPLVRGGLVHVGLAHHFVMMKAGINPNDYWTPSEAIDLVAASDGELGQELKPLVHSAVEAYIDQHKDWFEVVLVEEEIQATLKDTWLFTMRWDLAWRDASGRYWLVDHKTTGNLRSKGPSCYDHSGQVLAMQYLGSKVWGNQFGGVILNFIGMKPPFTFAQRQPAPAPNLVNHIVDDLCYLEEGIARLEASGRDPKEWPRAVHEHACHTRYGECDYYDLCSWGLR